jgi:hypothetical protein
MTPTVVLRSDRLELRMLEASDAEFVESLYANPKVTQTLLQIQRPISIEEAHEFCQVPAAASGDVPRFRLAQAHRPGQRPQPHRVGPGVATIGYSVLPAFWGQASVRNWPASWSSSQRVPSAPLKSARRL